MKQLSQELKITDGENFSRQEWVKFVSSPLWGAFLFEIQEREKYIVELLKENDQLWNADMIRGKLTELDYFRNIPQSIIASIIIKEANNTNKEKADETV